jgi:hypothetical protein
MEFQGKEYYVTQDDIINNSEITYDDLYDVFKEQIDKYLKLMSKRTYRVYHNSYKGLNRQRQIAFMDWWIQQDTNRQEVMREAIIEYVRGALMSGMDMNIYVNEKTPYTQDVIDILSQGELWFPQTIHYEDSDIE